jgi:hypothetical protein
LSSSRHTTQSNNYKENGNNTAPSKVSHDFNKEIKSIAPPASVPNRFNRVLSLARIAFLIEATDIHHIKLPAVNAVPAGCDSIIVRAALVPGPIPGVTSRGDTISVCSLSLALLLRLSPVMHQYAGGWQTLSSAFASLRRHSAVSASDFITAAPHGACHKT